VCVEYLKLLNTKKQRAGIVEIHKDKSKARVKVCDDKEKMLSIETFIHKKYNAVIESNKIY